jgi:type III pantothenate kinase
MKAGSNTPRLIAVDIGNSQTKIGWFSAAGAPLPIPDATLSFPTGQPPPGSMRGELTNDLSVWHISSVHREGTRLLAEWVAAHRPQEAVQVLTYRDLPIRIDVQSPEKVGLDRLAAAVGANVLREAGRPAIVVGAGSAITVNRISEDGAFEGGAILPGYKMQADALYGGADLLPLAMLAADAEPPPPLGKNTEAAIKSGLFWGAVGAVRELVRQMSTGSAKPPQIFVTGGDLRQLAARLGEGARFVPNLVLSGIAVAFQAQA